ncbi:MAG: hypothetical protein AAFR54_07855 [Planctomycetota bacterium]
MSALGPDLAFWAAWSFLAAVLLGRPSLRALASGCRLFAAAIARRSRLDLERVRRAR